MKYLFLAVLAWSLALPSFGQKTLSIAYLSDDSRGFAHHFESLLTSEIEALIGTRRDLRFQRVRVDDNPALFKQTADALYASDDVDIIISAGLASAIYIAQRDDYPKPTIISMMIDPDLFQIPYTPEGHTGVNNLTFINSTFDTKKDIELFSKIKDFDKLGVIIDQNTQNILPLARAYFQSNMPEGKEFEMIISDNTVEATIANIPEDIKAVYIVGAAQFSEDQDKEFYHQLAKKGIATFALIGRDQVKMGAMAGRASSKVVPTIARRTAIDVLKITEGTNAGDLPTELTPLSDDFTINMHTLNHLKIYPDFELLNQAILLDLDIIDGDVSWTLESLIYEALKSNLSLAVAKQNIDLADQDIKIAKSNLLPQLDINTSATFVDPTRVNSSFGQTSDITWIANANLNQVIYNEPALANVAVQNLLKRAQTATTRQTELDIVLQTAQAYLTYLQARANLSIQNENVAVTNQNLEISRSKESLGYSGISDVYRLQAQLSQNVISLNSAVAGVHQTRVNINRLINRDQNEMFATEDIDRVGLFSLSGQSDLAEYIKNQRDLDQFTDMMVQRAFAHLPELESLGYNIQASERSLLSNKRSLYTPSLGLQGSASKPLEYIGQPTPPQGFPGANKNLQYNATVAASLPIFQGGLRKANAQRGKIQIDQLENQRQDLKNNLEANLRTNIYTLSASYQQVQLAQEAADYAAKNFDIVQDLYRQGQVDIITLIDAQNASLSAELSATNALYQMIIDFLTVERATGTFYFLMDDAEKQEFINQARDAILKN